MASAIKKEIASEVYDLGFFTLIVDETKDIAKTEQLPIVLHYTYKSAIYEEFIGFQAAAELNAESLKDTILSVLNSVGVDVHLCVAQ